MTEPLTAPDATFRVSAEVVARLGEELITDRTQALLELVKNAYDAGATQVELVIDSEATTRIVAAPPATASDQHPDDTNAEPETGATPDEGSPRERPAAQRPVTITLTGALQVSDTGHGLDEEAITQGWLTLSASPKRAEKRSGRPPRGGRAPLGDKGLGRLGAQRLGDRLTLRTRPRARDDNDRLMEAAGGVEHRVVFRFSDFSADRTLDDVPIERTTMPVHQSAEPWPLPTQWGTVLVVEGLNDPQEWNVNALVGQLSGILNPFKRIPDFALKVTVDRTPVELIRVTRPLRESAISTWTADYADRRLVVRGQLRRQWLRPNNLADRERLTELLDAPNGTDLLLAAMQRQSGAGQFTLEPGSKPWLMTFRREIEFGEHELPGRDPATGRPVDCGPFHFELDNMSLNLNQAPEGAAATFSNQQEYRALIRDFAGVSVYRDGFAVASSFDLLRLGETFTAGGSFYGLRPGNTIGFVEISASHNAELEETTDREGFRRTPAFDRFDALLGKIRDEINQALEITGRGSGQMLKDDRKRRAGLTQEQPTAVEAAEEIAQRAAALAVTVSDASTTVADAVPAGDTNTQAAVTALAGAASALQDIGRLEPIAKTLRDEIDDLTGQLQDAYETVAVGIVAESLAHEMSQILDRLAAATADARKRLTQDAPAPRTQALYVEQVNDAIRALRTQLRHLDPQLRYARARRRVFGLAEVVSDVMSYYADRLHDQIDVDVEIIEDVRLRGMPGRLAQVLDNLALNSAHWVGQAVGNGAVPRGRIDVHVDGPILHFRDNGVGVRSDLRTSLFDAFVTSRSGGRGLGLFVSRQLLEGDGASIALTEPQPPVGTDIRVDLTGLLAEQSA